MSNKPATVENNDSITVIFDGEPYTVLKESSTYIALQDALAIEDWDGAKEVVVGETSVMQVMRTAWNNR